MANFIWVAYRPPEHWRNEILSNSAFRWLGSNNNIAKVSKCSTNYAFKAHSPSSKWTPWPAWCRVWEGIHGDYWGFFLGRYRDVLIIGAYSPWPKLKLGSFGKAYFITNGLWLLIVPQILVNIGRSQFNAIITYWTNGIKYGYIQALPTKWAGLLLKRHLLCIWVNEALLTLTNFTLHANTTPALEWQCYRTV